MLQSRPKLKIAINKPYNTIKDKKEMQTFVANKLIDDMTKKEDLNYFDAVVKSYIGLIESLKSNNKDNRDGDDRYDEIVETLEKKYKKDIDNDKLSKVDFNKIISKKVFKEMINLIKIDTKSYKSLATSRQKHIYNYMINHKIDSSRMKLKKKYAIDKEEKKKNEYIGLEIELLTK
jgi:hypothetical protein